MIAAPGSELANRFLFTALWAFLYRVFSDPLKQFPSVLACVAFVVVSWHWKAWGKFKVVVVGIVFDVVRDYSIAGPVETKTCDARTTRSCNLKPVRSSVETMLASKSLLGCICNA